MSGRHRRKGKAAKVITRGIAGTGIAAAIVSAQAPAYAEQPAAFRATVQIPAVHSFTVRSLTSIVVQPGDSLSVIAERHCGNPADWTGIYGRNRALIGGDPDLILPGQRLVLSCAQDPVSSPRQQSTGGVTSAVVSTAGMGGFQACVIARESGGNAQVMNSSGHYGLYQFSFSTWVAYGGVAADFGHASVAEQNQVFARAYAIAGVSPWRSYDGCLW